MSSLDGRRFRAVAEVAGGDVGPQTEFEYVERDDGVIHARYAGGAVRLGFLVGTRAGDSLRFRYAQLLEDGAHRDRPLRVARRGTARRAPAPARDVGVGLPGGSGTSVVEETAVPSGAARPARPRWGTPTRRACGAPGGR